MWARNTLLFFIYIKVLGIANIVTHNKHPPFCKRLGKDIWDRILAGCTSHQYMKSQIPDTKQNCPLMSYIRNTQLSGLPCSDRLVLNKQGPLTKMLMEHTNFLSRSVHNTNETRCVVPQCPTLIHTPISTRTTKPGEYINIRVQMISLHTHSGTLVTQSLYNTDVDTAHTRPFYELW